MESKKIKENGVVYTPKYIVDMILDQSGYYGSQILKKHVIDNSCGDGAFLTRIVERYITEFFKINELNIDTKLTLLDELKKFVHGIEIDQISVTLCQNNLNNILKKHDLDLIDWDVFQGNSLEVTKYDKMMDYVIGNPPYVRIHNIKKNLDFVKEQRFSNGGMTDLFIIFYDLGLNMLNDSGILSYITPSSIFHSIAGTNFRKHIITNKLLTSVIDFRHFQAFEKFITYTAIITLDMKNKHDIVEYSILNTDDLSKKSIDSLKYESFYLQSAFYFGKSEILSQLSDVLSQSLKDNSIEVKNGFATLNDSLFIQPEFNISSKYIYPVLKASTKKWNQIIFPYDVDGNPIDFDDLGKLKEYFQIHSQTLKNRSLEKENYWWLFGRSQGIKDFWKEKLAINTLIRKTGDLKIQYLKAGQGIYSGLYILADPSQYRQISNWLCSDDFANYVSLLGKYKSGGYYAFSTSDVKRFLLYMKNKESGGTI